MTWLRKHFTRVALGLLIVVIFIGHAAEWYSIPFVRTLEAIAYDARLQLTMPDTVDDRVVIVDIDEKSLEIEGHWPWHRDQLAILLDRLFDQYHVAILGFDVVFAERDETSGLKVLRQLGEAGLKSDPKFQAVLKEITPSLQYDRLFADKIRGRPIVLGYYFNNHLSKPSNMSSADLPAAVFPPGSFQNQKVSALSYSGYGGNLPELLKAASSAGHFNAEPDADGVHRKAPMLAEFGGAYYEPLSLSMVRLLQGSPPLQAHFAEPSIASSGYLGLEWLTTGRVRIPIDSSALAFIPYRGGERSFPHISATDVLRGTADAAVLKNRIVLVGSTAPGLLDLRATPVSPAYPGVEIHANLITGMLDGSIKQSPAYLHGAEVLLLTVVGGFLALVLPLLNPLRASAVSGLVFGLMVGANVWLWVQANLVLPLAASALEISLLFALNMSYGFFVESYAKRKMASRFGQYVPPELVDEMSFNPKKFSMDGDSREMSVLFADVRGFTKLSEGLDPKELTQLMNQFLTPLTRVIYQHRGTIDKYMGDCIMAFWGAPVSDPQHARRAVLAGLGMQAAMDALQPQFKARGWPELHIGVGINTGRMSVGNMGSEIRVAYTVMGDAVNLASRFEELTRHYGARMIVGETTRGMSSDVAFREIDRVRVRGRIKSVAIFEPICLATELDESRRHELLLWEEALKSYRRRDWDRAELPLSTLRQRCPDSLLYTVFLHRIAELRGNPPSAAWDGAWLFEAK